MLERKALKQSICKRTNYILSILSNRFRQNSKVKLRRKYRSWITTRYVALHMYR